MIFVSNVTDIAEQGLADKQKRAEVFGAVKDEFKATLSEEDNCRIRIFSWSIL